MTLLIGWFLLIAMIAYVALSAQMATRYLRKSREISNALWIPSLPVRTLEELREENRKADIWLKFYKATEGDWASCPQWKAMLINPWRPSVWRKLNPDLYR